MPRPASTAEDFGERLRIALHALNLSRAQLAARAGVDKSLVARWIGGRVRPGGHNLARVSSAIAESAPGFNALLWECPRAEFEAFLGITPSSVAAAPSLPSQPDPLPAPATPRPLAATPAPAGPRQWRRWTLPAAGAVLLIALVAAAVWLRPAAAPPSAAPRAQATPSLAVMPFANLSGDPERDYFSDGFAQALIDSLANVPGLRVASRTDSFAFKQRAATTAEIAGKLRVGAILEGSVREDGGRIRVTTQLIDAASGNRLWSQRYDRDLTDVLKVQDEIAEAIAAALTNRLVASGPRPRPRSIDPEVYRLFLQGVDQGYTGTPESMQRAVAMFREVTRREPEFVEGFVKLGMGLSTLWLADRNNRALTAETDAAFERALQLDPGHAFAMGAYSYQMLLEWRWREGVALARRAEIAQPSADGTIWGKLNVASSFALYDRAVPLARTMVERRPSDAPLYEFLAGLQADRGDYRESLRTVEAGLVLRPDSSTLLMLRCLNRAMLGELDAARADLRRLEARPGGPTSNARARCAINIMAKAEDLAGLRTLAGDLARRHPGDRSTPARTIGFAYQQAGDFDQAMRWYRVSFAERGAVVYLPYWRPERFTRPGRTLFADPRWKAFWDEPPIREWRRVRDELARLPATSPSS